MNQLNSNEVMLASFTKLLQNINSEYTLSQHTDKLRLELPLKSPLIHELLLFILSQVKLHYFNKKQTDQISTLSKESLELVMKAFINKKVKSTKEHLYIYLIIIVSVLTGIQLTEDIFEKPLNLTYTVINGGTETSLATENSTQFEGSIAYNKDYVAVVDELQLQNRVTQIEFENWEN